MQAEADWIFTPGIGKNCAFTIAIPDSATITSTSAEYQVYRRLGVSGEAVRAAGRLAALSC